MGRSRGGGERGSGLLLPGMSQVAKVSLEILVRTPLEMQLDPLGPTASRGRIVRPSVKYVDDLKKTFSYPPPHTHTQKEHKNTDFLDQPNLQQNFVCFYHQYLLLLLYSIDTRNISITKQFSSHLVGEERVGCFTFFRKQNFQCKIVNVFLPMILAYFWCSKEHLQRMFYLRNKLIIFLIRTLN